MTKVILIVSGQALFFAGETRGTLAIQILVVNSNPAIERGKLEPKTCFPKFKQELLTRNATYLC